MARRGRTAAILLGLFCAAVLGGGGFAFRNRIVEEWYLWKLRSEDPAESDRAALKLASMSSLRAVAPLLNAILKGGRGEPIDYIPELLNRNEKRNGATCLMLPPKAYALYQLGAGALPSIEKVLESEGRVSSYRKLVAVSDAIQGEHREVKLRTWELPRIWQSYPPLTSP